MKIATWNINECVGITTNLDNQQTGKINKQNMEEIIRKINEFDFDVVCFQEYPVLIDGEERLTKQIIEQTALKNYYTYDTYDSFLFDGGRTGVAIFSKYELKDKYCTLFNNPDMTKTSSNGIVYHSVDKGILKVNIDIDRKNYTVINAHAISFAPYDKTAFDYPESYKPLEELINDNLGGNLVVLGDFNSEKALDLMPTIKGELKDAVVWPTTKEYYEKRGAVQIDYVLFNKNIELIDAYKLDNYSDHYIVGADIL